MFDIMYKPTNDTELSADIKNIHDQNLQKNKKAII